MKTGVNFNSSSGASRSSGRITPLSRSVGPTNLSSSRKEFPYICRRSPNTEHTNLLSSNNKISNFETKGEMRSVRSADTLIATQATRVRVQENRLSSDNVIRVRVGLGAESIHKSPRVSLKRSSSSSFGTPYLQSPVYSSTPKSTLSSPNSDYGNPPSPWIREGLPAHRTKMRMSLLSALQKSRSCDSLNTPEGTNTDRIQTPILRGNMDESPNSETLSTDSLRTPINRLSQLTTASTPPNSHLHVVVAQIEMALQSLPSGRVLSQFRTLHFNLNDDKNEDLRTAVLDRTLDSEKLVRMTSAELANPDLRVARKANVEAHLDRINTKNHKVGTRTTFFTCSKCHGNDTTFYEMQTASADEPSTKFVTCLNCGKSWKFR